MRDEQPSLAERETSQPLTLDYARVKLRARRHGGPGNDWWALWALGLWFVIVGALVAYVFTRFS